MKIARKISLSFLLTGLILTTVAVFIIYIAVKSNMKKTIYQHLMTAVESRANHIETFLEEHKNIVKLLSTDIFFIEILNINKDNPEYHKKFKNVNYRLNAVIKIHKDIIKTNLLDKNGVVIASSDKASVGSDKSDDEIFLNAKEATYIKDVHVSKTSVMPGITLATPVLWNGESLGVFITDFSAKELFNIVLDRTGLGETGEIYLVNKDYYMISPSRFIKNVILKQKVDTVNVRHCMEHRDKEHMSTSKMIGVFKDYRDRNVIGTHAYIPEMKWALLAEIDEKEALRPLEMITLMLVAILISVPIIAWLIGIFVSGMISGPIHTLHKGTEIIASGNLDYQIDIDAKDEIGQLSRAFNKMTGDLKKTTISIDELYKENNERRRIEKNLRDSEEKYRLLASNLPGAVYRGYKDGTVYFYGDKTELFFGYSVEEFNLNKMSFSEIIMDEDLALFKQILVEALKTDKQYMREYKIETRTGDVLWVHDRGHIIIDDNGQINYIDGVLFDITERKRDEKELKKYRENLEKLVKERTSELVMAKIQAEESNRAKSEFLANMSHELHTPLNHIKGMTYLCFQTELTAQQKGYLQKLDNACQSLMEMINDLLDFSKVEEGDLKIEQTAFDLRGLLENLKSTFLPLAGKKNLDFVLSFTPEVPTMLVGDARRLSQILSNLLDNAVKFTEKGGVALRIDRESSNEQLILCFEIEDTGIGMTQDQIGQLFQPFTQIDGSSTRMYGGTGLGLSLTKRLVEMMGGTISVESEKGIGSTFSFTAVFETVSKDMSAELEDADAWGVEAPETPSRTAEVEADTIEHLDVSIMAPKLAELSDLIRDDDTRAIRKFGEIKDYLNIPAIRGDVTILERALREYDFEDALAALSRIMDQMGMSE